jgi:hypothetical protein
VHRTPDFRLALEVAVRPALGQSGGVENVTDSLNREFELKPDFFP